MLHYTTERWHCGAASIVNVIYSERRSTHLNVNSRMIKRASAMVTNSVLDGGF